MLHQTSAFASSSISPETSFAWSIISVCAAPDGIIGKQLASLATRQSTITGPSCASIACDAVVELGRVLDADALPAIGLGQLHEIGQRCRE